MRVSSLDHLHLKTRSELKMPKMFVLHSLRHSFLTRLGLAGVDAFTIMRLAGHSSVTISQRYVHPTPEALENALIKLEALNRRETAIEDEKRQLLATVSATSDVAVSVSH